MRYILLFVLLFLSLNLKSQDCNGYWNTCHNDTVNNYHDSYQLVVNDKGQGVSKSANISDVEILETVFDIFSGRDYRMSICSSYEYMPILRLYEYGTNNVIYDNSQNDSILVFEFEQRFNMKIKAVVSIPQSKKRKVSNLIVEKPKRYCIGFKLESMITRK
ncbi:MAG: hypothetical protein WC979_02400 [Candidatus Pacearchaeota archaeon]|jgi:hypothetical protein|nr:hypothetical protein [Clostridia bacterium]